MTDEGWLAVTPDFESEAGRVACDRLIDDIAGHTNPSKPSHLDIAIVLSVIRRSHGTNYQRWIALTPRMKAVLVLRYGLDGQGIRTVSTIARQAGVSPSTVQQCESAARIKLRSALNIRPGDAWNYGAR